jgi:hypothetical protein
VALDVEAAGIQRRHGMRGARHRQPERPVPRFVTREAR